MERVTGVSTPARTIPAVFSLTAAVVVAGAVSLTWGSSVTAWVRHWVTGVALLTFAAAALYGHRRSDGNAWAVFWVALGAILGFATVGMGTQFYGPGHRVTVMALFAASTVVAAASLISGLHWVPSRRGGAMLGLAGVVALVIPGLFPPPYQSPWGAVGYAAFAGVGVALTCAFAPHCYTVSESERWSMHTREGLIVLGGSIVFLGIMGAAPYLTTPI